MELTNILTIEDELDQDGEIELCVDDKVFCAYLNRSDTIKLISHLTKCFNISQVELENK